MLTPAALSTMIALSGYPVYGTLMLMPLQSAPLKALQLVNYSHGPDNIYGLE